MECVLIDTGMVSCEGFNYYSGVWLVAALVILFLILGYYELLDERIKRGKHQKHKNNEGRTKSPSYIKIRRTKLK